MLSRRHLLLQLLSGVCMVACSGLAQAESGSGSNGSGGGNSGSGGGNSGSGSDNSGPGNNNDDDNDEGEDDNQDEVSEAVKRGEATALRDILAKLKKKYAGEIVHVGLKKHSNRFVYTIKLIDRTGMLMLVRVDARNGTILGEQGI